MTLFGATLLEIYHPAKVALSVQLGLPLLASESKFCVYVPLLIEIWADAGCPGKTVAARVAKKNFSNDFTSNYRF